MGFFSRKKKQTSVRLEDFDIPSFPAAIVNILGKLRNPEVGVNELVADLELDPGLHLRVLKMVNSSAFGLSRKVSNIKHAVNLLGQGRLESLVLSVAVKNNLAIKDDAKWFDIANFWHMASKQAAVARILANTLHPNNQSDVFTLGLLQNMAIPVLVNREGDRYRTLYQQWQKEDINLAEMEFELFGIDHPTLGAKMAEHWGFPPSLVLGISEHHELNNIEIPLSVKLSAMMRENSDSDTATYLAQRATELYKQDNNTIFPLIEQALEQSSELSTALD